MTLVSSGIPNLVNGVSQQPPTLRQPSQCTDQINCYPTIVDSNKKRPPLELLKRITSSPISSAFVHTINRDLAEQYQVVIAGGTLRVFELLTGTERTVAFPNGSAYLASAAPEQGFAAVTVADYTFITNRNTPTAMLASPVSPVNNSEALVFIRQAVNGLTYTVTIPGFGTSSYTTSATAAVSTSDIASNLAGLLAAGLGAGWTITRSNYCIRIRKNDNSNFNITTEDGRSGDSLKYVTSSVQTFTQLPAVAPAGYIVKILGDNSNQFDNYYVKFVCSSPGITFGEGSWVETIAPGIQYQLNKATMPHSLVRNGDGTFTFAQITWKDRACGDLESSADPSFIGAAIRDIFLHKNRLGFLSDENIIWSEQGGTSYFNFFRTTATTILDTDPIDIAAAHTKVSLLNWAIPYNERLYLFSDETEFVVETSTILTAKTVAIAPASEFGASKKARPVALRNNIYFPKDDGDFTLFNEYYIQQITANTDAANITAHVPQYIPSGIVKVAGTSTQDTILALSENDRGVLYNYKYYWKENTKLQSAWSKWAFDSQVQILNVDFIQSRAYVLYNRTDGCYLAVMDLSGKAKDAGAEFKFSIDHRITEAQIVSASYNSATNLTTIVIPYQPGSTVQMISRYGTSGQAPGVVVPIVSVAGAVLTVKGNWTAKKYYIGLPYLQQYKFSPFFVKQQQSSGAGEAISGGRLQLNRMRLKYSNSGYFKARVLIGADEFVHTYAGSTLGSASGTLGQIAIGSGDFEFPIMARNTDVQIIIENNTFLPATLVSAEWEGNYYNRSQRLPG